MNYRLRIKHPSGAEFEAEGPEEFIQSEKEGFLARVPAIAGIPQRPAQPAPEGGSPDWAALTETKKDLLILRNKHPQLTAGEVALLILAAERQLTGSRQTGAITLSRAVKASGYAPERLDRALSKALREGLIKASGNKRSRSYQITDKGLEAAWLEARKL